MVKLELKMPVMIGRFLDQMYQNLNKKLNIFHMFAIRMLMVIVAKNALHNQSYSYIRIGKRQTYTNY